MAVTPWSPVFSPKVVAIRRAYCLTQGAGVQGEAQPSGRAVGRSSSRRVSVCAIPQIGLFDLEVNCLTKILFGALVVVSLVMVALQHFAGRWYLQIIRFLLLFSNIIPIRCAESELVPRCLRVSVSLKAVLLWF